MVCWGLSIQARDSAEALPGDLHSAAFSWESYFSFMLMAYSPKCTVSDNTETNMGYMADFDLLF